MTPERLSHIASRYPSLRIAVVGDYCLDRYLEINPERTEVSIETGLPVYNVERVRPQPGAAGTILNNLVSLGVGTLLPVGFFGEDGEGYELERALRSMPGVDTTYFLATDLRRTFTYTKPLVMRPGAPPQELNRLDTKNWTPTPESLSLRLTSSLRDVLSSCDAVIVMDQVDVPETGVITKPVLEVIRAVSKERLVIADSRRGLAEYPPCLFKMNAAELACMSGSGAAGSGEAIAEKAALLASKNGYPVVVTMAEKGILGALPDGTIRRVPSLPVRGEIDVVGAGDSVTANIAAALAGGASMHEAIALAAVASSVVIHQLGTSGSASVDQIRALLG